MAKYSEKGMFDKLSEFSSSRKKNSDLKKYPDGGINKFTYSPYSLGYYSPLVSNPVYNPSQVFSYYSPHLFTNESQGTFRTPIELSIGLPYDRSVKGLTNPALSLNDPKNYSINDYNYALTMPNADMSQTMYQDMADYFGKDVHDLTEQDLNTYAAATALEKIKPKYSAGLPIDVGLRYSIMGMKQNSQSPVRGGLSLNAGYNAQAGFFGGVDAGAYGLLGNVNSSKYLRNGLTRGGDFMFTPSLNLAVGLRQRSGYLPDQEKVDKYLELLQADVDAGTSLADNYYRDNLDADVQNVNWALKPELKFEYKPFDKLPVNLEAVVGANIDGTGKRQGQMDQLIPGVAPYGRVSAILPIAQVKRAIDKMDLFEDNFEPETEEEYQKRQEEELLKQEEELKKEEEQKINEKQKDLDKNKRRGKAGECPDGMFRRCYEIDEEGNVVCPCEYERSAHPRWLRDGGEFLTVDGENHRVYKNANGDIIVNHPQEDKGKWDTINLTDKANAKTVAEGVAATRKWHRENPMKNYAEGGIADFTNFPAEQFITITGRQKKLAQSLINSGDINKYFPELYEYYLSKENSQRIGGPLNMEQIVIEKLRKEPNFLQVMQSKKFSQQVPRFDEGGLFGKRRKKKGMGPDYGQPGYLDDIWNTTHMIDPITGEVNANEDWKTKTPLVINQPGQGFELPGDELTQEEKWARQEATYPIVTQEDVDWSAGMAKLDQTLSDLKAEREALQLKNQEWAAQQWQDKLTKRKEDFEKKGKHDPLEPFETIPKYEYDSRINANPDYLEELRQQGYFVNVKDDIVELYPATEIQSRIWDNGLRTGEIVNKLGVGTAESIKESFGTIMDQADQYHAYQTKNFLLDLMKKGMSRDAAIDYLVNKKGLGQSRESLEKLYNQDFNEVEKWAKSFVAYSDEYEKPYEQGQDLELINRWNDNDIITLAKDRDFIDSHGANIDIVSPNYSNSPDYGAQILYKLRTGKWGWMPKSNQLVRLDSDDSYKALITEPSQLDVQSMNKLKDYTSLTPQAFGQKYSPTLVEAEKRWKDGRVAVQIASEDSWRPNKMFVTDPNKKDAFGNPSGQFYQYSFQVPTGGVDPMTGELLTKTVTPDEMAGQTVYMTQEEADKYNKAMLGDNMEEFYKHPLFYAPGVIAAAPFAAGAFGSAMAYAPFSTLPGLTVGNALGAYGAYETLKPQGFAQQAYDAFQRGDTDEAWKNTAFSALGLLPAVKPLVGSYRALNTLRTPGANAILKTPSSYSLLAKTPSGSNLLAGNTNLANTTEMFPGFTSRLNRFTGANNLGEYKLLRQTAPQLGESQAMQLANQTPLTKFLGSGTTSLPAFSNQALQLSNGLQSQLSVPSLKQGFNLQNANGISSSQNRIMSSDDIGRDQQNYIYTQLSGKDEYDAYLKRFPNLIQENQNLGKQSYFGEEGFLPGETLEQAQQRVFDQATDFSQKWMFKDPLKYEDLSNKILTNHNDLVSLKQNKYYDWHTYAERPILDTYLRDVKGLSDYEVQDLYTGLNAFRTYGKPFLKPSEAFGRYAGNDATALTQKYDDLEALRQEMHSSGYFDKAMSQQDPTVKLAYNRGLKLAQQEQQLYDDSFSLYDEIEANMDPDFRGKIGELYTLSGRPMPQYMHGMSRENIGKLPLDLGGKKISMWDPLFSPKRTALVDIDPTAQNFSNLSFDDQDYLLKNYQGLNGVRTSDGTITLASKPEQFYFLAKPKQIFNETKPGYYEQINEFQINNPLTWKNNRFNPWFKPKYNWIEPEGTYSYLDPNSDGTAKLINRSLQRVSSLEQVGGVNAHEIGHDMQPMYDKWINLIQKYDQDAGYYTGHSDNILAETYNEAMVNPLPAKEVTKADGTVEKDYDYQTWLSSPGELHSELQKARFKFATQIMKEKNIDMDTAIKQLKQMENTGDDELYQYYLDSGFGNLNKHFKPEATYETKKSLIQILPQVGITIGVGGAAGTMMSNGQEQQTTNNRYGGSIKKLSKFIRK